jgi:tRNA1(Val) A37 N6-methylase TrmN6
MQIELGENERIDDLQCNGYRIIQNTACFCFGMDAVLLSSFAAAGAKDKVLDLCTGNGVIPILMRGKTECRAFTGIEVQEVSYGLALRNASLNGLEADIRIIKGNIKDYRELLGGEVFDVVTCNPPYMNENHGLVNPDSVKAIARHEILCNLEDVICTASKCLGDRGRFYMVHRPRRLVDIFELCRKYRLEPKRMRMVHSYADSQANMVLIEAVKEGGTQLIVEKPLVIYKSEGVYSEELIENYGE